MPMRQECRGSPGDDCRPCPGLECLAGFRPVASDALARLLKEQRLKAANIGSCIRERQRHRLWKVLVQVSARRMPQPPTQHLLFQPACMHQAEGLFVDCHTNYLFGVGGASFWNTV